MVSGKECVDEVWCKQNLKDKQVYIFGAGVDGEKTYKRLKEENHIVAFIDNKKCGNFFCDKKVISLEEYKRIKTKDTIILVAVYRYVLEVVEQLLKEQFEAGKDFFVWDDMHILQPDDICIKYVELQKKIWEEEKIESDNQILLAFDNRHDTDTVIYSYCANYLAKKYNASIMGFCRYGADYRNASNVMIDIYKSINMKEIIKTDLSVELQKESERIFSELWDGLYTWEDWKNITIYNIRFGTTVIADYLRMKIPNFDLRDFEVKQFIKKTVDTIVFWYNYIVENKVKAVVLADGVCWEGYIRDIAITMGIPAYAVLYTMQRTYLNFHNKTDAYLHYKEMWEQLSKEEKEYGMRWARERIEARTKGKVEDIDVYNAMNFTFAQKKTDERLIEENGGINVVIFPHIFEENAYHCGTQIFDDSYMSWLCHLGELSEITPQYNWFLKMHPSARRRDPIIMSKILERYPRIKLLPAKVSPKQLKEEGVRYALTVCGTLGHEFPAIGIEVINAGVNPHSAFDFTWNPTTKEEYDNLIMNLHELKPKKNLDELYQFYCMHYLYYDREYIHWQEIFFDNPYLAMSKEHLEAYGKEYGTWKYDEYMKEWSEGKHKRILESIPEMFEMMDNWKPTIFYRKKR